ncbi:MAG: hypothetical protein JKX79_11620 [Labilibaculum sp.]|nr:hypothetical protein [Labilibaculum sp.]
MRTALITLCLSITITGIYGQKKPNTGSNPIITDRFTADPAALVYRDTVFFYVGHDEAKGDEMFNMNQWLCYFSTDMKNWISRGPIMKATDFKWATRDAWAAQVIEKDGNSISTQLLNMAIHIIQKLLVLPLLIVRWAHLKMPEVLH